MCRERKPTCEARSLAPSDAGTLILVVYQLVEREGRRGDRWRKWRSGGWERRQRGKGRDGGWMKGGGLEGGRDVE